MSRDPFERSLARLKESRGHTIAVCLPALDEEATIGPICRAIDGRLRRDVGLVDEVLVIDSGSRDRTRERARRAGARVLETTQIAPRLEPAGGKGEALWKSLAATECNVVVWLDSDVTNFDPGWVTALVAPLLQDEASMTKGAYRRPLAIDAAVDDDGGGRVTEVFARPLISALWPDIAHIRQPLAGECASFLSLLRGLPFLSGYAVELGVLVEFAHSYGSAAIRDVDLGFRRHRNRALTDLGKMSFEILHGAALLLEGHGRSSIAGLSDALVQPEGDGENVHRVNVRRLPPMEEVLDRRPSDPVAATR